MSFPQVLEVAIGLILVYYIMGSIVSMVTQVITETLESRGMALAENLKKIAGENVDRLINMPQIQALKPIRYKGLLSVFVADTAPKMVEKIPPSTLVDAFFDLTGLTACNEATGDELFGLIGRLPESEGKQAMLSWVQQGVTKIEDIRTRTNAYFTGVMDQAAAKFKARARSIVIILSIIITFFLGTDTIQLTKDLWASAELRAIATAQADVVIQQQGATADISSLLNDLGSLTIRIGWWRTQNWPQSGEFMAWVSFIFFKLLGLSLTAVAVSQGSSFWYDLLKKIAGRSTSKPDEAKG